MPEQTGSSWADRVAVFDLETTGVDISTARIVTAFVGLLDANGELEAHQSWIANPGVEIPAAAAAVHGITTERAIAEGAPPAQVAHEIIARIARIQSFGIGVVAFNAAYDFSILDAEAQRYGLAPLAPAKPVIDPYVLDKQFDKYRKGKRTLGITCEHYGITLEEAHDASADAIAAGLLAQAMAKKFPDLAIPIASLHEHTEQWANEQSTSFAQWKQKTDPSFTAEVGWPVRAAK